MRPALIDGGFVRSWKLNLRLTTRAEDSHAAPNPVRNLALRTVARGSRVQRRRRTSYPYFGCNTWTMPLQSRLESW